MLLLSLGVLGVLLALGVGPVTATQKCLTPHAVVTGRSYWFSWEDSEPLQLHWYEARNYCRDRCMDLVSLETHLQHYFVGKRMVQGRQPVAWTSGHKCTTAIGCDRADLQPASVYGWYWVGTMLRLPPTTNRAESHWSSTGGLGKPQPDNEEYLSGGPPENCLAITNNLYKDGMTWHDMPCGHRHPFVCEKTGFRAPVLRKSVLAAQVEVPEKCPEEECPDAQGEAVEVPDVEEGEGGDEVGMEGGDEIGLEGEEDIVFGAGEMKI